APRILPGMGREPVGTVRANTGQTATGSGAARRGWVAAIRSLVVGSTIPLTIAIPTTPALAAPTDSDIVFCLSPPQRGQLADAALNLASPGKRPGDVMITTAGVDIELSVADWRSRRTGDFNRACTALARSPRPAATVESTRSGNDLGSTLTGLIPVAFGALL